MAPRFYGPFQVLQKLREISYKLDLPIGSLIHPAFYVSNLKAKLGQNVVPRPTLPAMSANQIISPKPVTIQADKSHQLRSRTITQVVVQWQGESKEVASLENLYELQHKFLHLVGKLL